MPSSRPRPQRQVPLQNRRQLAFIVRSRCWIIASTRLGSRGDAPTSRLRASMPPADAPTPTIGNGFPPTAWVTLRVYGSDEEITGLRTLTPGGSIDLLSYQLPVTRSNRLPAKACAMLGARADVSAKEIFEVTETTIPRSGTSSETHHPAQRIAVVADHHVFHRRRDVSRSQPRP